MFQVFVSGIHNSKEDEKSSYDVDSATNLILACCGIRIQFTECTVWTRNDRIANLIATVADLMVTFVVKFK